MITQDILIKARNDLRDIVGTDAEKKWSDYELIDDYANDAEARLCEKCLLLEDYETVDESLASARLVLSGSDGSVESITVNGVELLAAPVEYESSLTDTAVKLANSINENETNPKYRASATGAIVVITASTGTGASPNGFPLVVSTSGALSVTGDSSLTGGYSLTRLYYNADQASYSLHPKVLHVIRAKVIGAKTPLRVISMRELDMEFEDWEEKKSELPTILALNIKMRRATLIPTPTKRGECRLAVYRYPLVPMSIARPYQAPEIPLEYHRYLFNWMYYRAFSKADAAETMDASFAAFFYNRFLEDVETINLNEIRRDNMQRVCSPLSSMI